MRHESESQRVLLMGLDVGTTSVKGLVVTSWGKIVASAREEYLLQIPKPGWAEQNPEDWWRASREVIRTLLSSITGADIAAVGLSGQMHGAVFLDAEGTPIRPAILWNDARTSAECLDIEERVGREQLRKIAGNPALTGFQAPKVLWLKRHEPKAYRRLHYLLLPKDYVRYRLSGNLATDASDAAGTLLLDLEQRDWSAEILEVLKIERSWLPRVYESPEVTGHVSKEGKRASGLTVGTPTCGWRRRQRSRSGGCRSG